MRRQSEKTIARVEEMLNEIDTASDSSGWLRESYVADPTRFDAIFNYEAMLIEANGGYIHGGKARI